MKESIVNKLHTLLDRHEEIAGLLADPDVIADQNQFRSLWSPASKVITGQMMNWRQQMKC